MVEDRKISFLSKHLRRRLWVQTPGQGDVTMFVYMEPVYLYCGFIGQIYSNMIKLSTPNDFQKGSFL